MSESPLVNDKNRPSDDAVKSNLQLDYLQTADGQPSKLGSDRDLLALNNPAAERQADNGFGLLTDGGGARGIDRPKVDKPQEGLKLPGDDPPDPNEVMKLDDQERVIESTDKHGITTKYDYKDDGSIEATPFKEEKQIGETKKYPNAKIDLGGTLTWNDGKTSSLKRVDGFSQTRNLKDGRILESTDTSGATTKYDYAEDGTLEAKQIVDGKQVGETKRFPNGKIDEKGTISWDDGKTGHVVGLDGYREERNIKEGSAKIYYPHGAWAEQRRDDKGIYTTTFADQVNNRKVSEKTEFAEPQTLKVDMPTGQTEIPGIKSITSFYDQKTGQTIAQSLTFAQQLDGNVEAFGGELKYQFSSLDIFKSEGGNEREAIFHLDNVMLKGSDGVEREVAAERVHQTMDKAGTAMLGLSFSYDLNPFISTSLDGPNVQERDGQKAAAAEDPKMRALIDKLGSPKSADRMAAKDALVEAGKAAMPALRSGLSHKDPEVRSLAQRSINEISVKQASQPLPRSFVQEMQEIDARSFSTQLAPKDVKALTPERRAQFEKLIAEADKPSIAGLDKEELRVRLKTLQTASEKRLEDEMKNDDNLDDKWVVFPLSDHKNGAVAATQASNYLKGNAERQLVTEERLVGDAAYSSGRVRAMYASTLSGTGDEADRKKAVQLLTDVIKKDPGIVPVARETEDGATFGGGLKNDFLTAIVASKALDDAEFIAAFHAQIKNAGLTLEMMRDL